MNLTGKKCLCVTAGLISSILLTVSSSAANADSTAGIVTTSSSPLTVRASASASSGRRASLARGSAVTLLSRSGSWWYVEYDEGKYGYCHASYLTQLTDSYAAQVATSYGNLNVRSGLSSNTAVVGSLSKGETVVVLSTSSGWSKILYDGTDVGYVSASYLKKSGTGTASGYSSVSLSVPSYKQYDTNRMYGDGSCNDGKLPHGHNTDSGIYVVTAFFYLGRGGLLAFQLLRLYRRKLSHKDLSGTFFRYAGHYRIKKLLRQSALGGCNGFYGRISDGVLLYDS